LFFLLCVIVVFATLQVFYRFIDHSPFSLFEDDRWWPLVYSITLSLLVTTPYFFIKRRKAWFFVVLVFFNSLLLSNILYYRTYKSLITVYTLQQGSNLKGLGPSIIASFRNYDFFFILPSLILIAFYFVYFKKRLVTTPWHFRLRGWAIVMLPFIIAIYCNLRQKDKNNELETEIDIFRYYPCYGSSYYSPLAYWVFQYYDYWETYQNRDLTSNDLSEIKSWIAEKEKSKGELNINTSKVKKNLIVILVESLESWPIGCSIESTELMPNLNKLVKSRNNIYASHVLAQVKDGESSDAQLIINTGLLPVNTGSAFFRFSHQKYYSIANALKTRGNYNSMTIMGYAPAFWNQGEMNPQLGIDSLISSNELDMTDVFGMGLSDESLFKQSITRMKTMQQPFYAQVVTLSSHMPFEIPEDRVNIKLPKDIPEVMTNYLRSVSYVDMAIGRFIEELKQNGLFDNSIIVITGDHNALADDQRKEFLKNKYLARKISKYRFVPFLVLNAPVNLNYRGVIGQIDIYPTLLDVLGVRDYEWNGLGNSLLSKRRDVFAVDPTLTVFGDTTKVGSSNIRYYQKAWRISDLIIGKDYFKQMGALAQSSHL